MFFGSWMYCISSRSCTWTVRRWAWYASAWHVSNILAIWISVASCRTSIAGFCIHTCVFCSINMSWQIFEKTVFGIQCWTILLGGAFRLDFATFFDAGVFLWSVIFSWKEIHCSYQSSTLTKWVFRKMQMETARRRPKNDSLLDKFFTKANLIVVQGTACWV